MERTSQPGGGELPIGLGSQVGPAPSRHHRMADRVLVLLTVAVAWLLGCQELFDGDVWWHVRSGQWIWEHGRVPRQDPFTFTSLNHPWIDLHWLFQLLLASAHALGGVPGMISLTAAVGASVPLVGLVTRDRSWPTWLVAACWLPAVAAMSARLVPRPEILSFLAIAGYLAVLFRTERRPVLAWMLPAVQVIWVNSHALFVLGPILLAGHWIGRLLDSATRRGPDRGDRPRARGWWHLAGATGAVALACLANPYGIRGAIFPLELYPKITTWGGVYKAMVVEFMSPREGIQRYGLPALGSLFTRLECGLLWALPASFMIPGAWRTWWITAGTVRPGRVAISVWISAAVLAGGLILVGALGLPAPGSPQILAQLGELAAPAMAILGILGACALLRSSRQAALLAAIAGLSEAAWVEWLRAYLMGAAMPGIGSPDAVGIEALCGAAAALGLAAAVLILRYGTGNMAFRMIVASVFGYLTLQAVRNIGLFSMVAGFILAWNLGEWSSELTRVAGGPILGRRGGLAAHLIVTSVIGAVIFTIVSGRFFGATYANRKLGLWEQPVAYAHDAARFAGRPGLPDRAFVYGVTQSAVYLFHNGPGRKTFMDGRLEVASRETFETYIRLERLLAEDRPGWRELLRPMGDVVIMLEHQRAHDAEATLLMSPEWRCVYFDAAASVFLPRRRRDLEASSPSVDFVAEHFRPGGRREVRQDSEAVAEARALLYLATSLGRRNDAPAWLRIALASLAGDRLRSVVTRDPHTAPPWVPLGDSFWSMVPDLAGLPPGLSEPWDPARGLLPAQGSFCYRRGVGSNPDDVSAFSTLSQAYRAVGIRDAVKPSELRPGRARPAGPHGVDARGDAGGDPRQSPLLDEPRPEADRDDRSGLTRDIHAKLVAGQAESAVDLFVASRLRAFVPSWSISDQVAVALLYLGRPAEARAVWEEALDPPSQALRLARIAAAELAELDFTAARVTYQASLKRDPALGEAWVGLALLHAELGEAPETLAAVREGRRHPLTPAQQVFFRELQATAGKAAP